jgi:hypothetical protein
VDFVVEEVDLRTLAEETFLLVGFLIEADGRGGLNGFGGIFEAVWDGMAVWNGEEVEIDIVGLGVGVVVDVDRDVAEISCGCSRLADALTRRAGRRACT